MELDRDSLLHCENNSIEHCRLYFDLDLICEQILAAVSTSEITNWVMNTFSIESNLRDLILEAKQVVSGKSSIQDLEYYANSLFLKTPILWEVDYPMNTGFITRMFYLWTLGDSNKKRQELIDSLTPTDYFQPITKDSKWNGSRKTIAVLFNPNITKQMLNPEKIVKNFRSTLAHELTHNEQYLDRLHLSWKDKLNQYFSTIDEDDYYNRKDEISAYAMQVVETYSSNNLEIGRLIVYTMKQKAKDHKRSWNKFVKTIFDILNKENKTLEYARNLAKEMHIVSNNSILQQFTDLALRIFLKGDYDEDNCHSFPD